MFDHRVESAANYRNRCLPLSLFVTGSYYHIARSTLPYVFNANSAAVRCSALFQRFFSASSRFRYSLYHWCVVCLYAGNNESYHGSVLARCSCCCPGSSGADYWLQSWQQSPAVVPIALLVLIFCVLSSVFCHTIFSPFYTHTHTNRIIHNDATLFITVVSNGWCLDVGKFQFHVVGFCK